MGLLKRWLDSRKKAAAEMWEIYEIGVVQTEAGERYRLGYYKNVWPAGLFVMGKLDELNKD